MAEPAYFDADAVEVSDEVSCTFKLNGREWSCRDRDRIDARIVGAVLGNGTMNVLQFFTEVLIPEDSEAFAEKLNAPDFPLPLARTQRLMEFLVEQILNRPTVPLGSSGGGRQTTRATSGESSSSRATRRQRSAS